MISHVQDGMLLPDVARAAGVSIRDVLIEASQDPELHARIEQAALALEASCLQILRKSLKGDDLLPAQVSTARDLLAMIAKQRQELA